MNHDHPPLVFTVVTRARAARVRPGRAAVRELSLAALITGVTWAVAHLSFDSAWTFFDCLPVAWWAWAGLAAGTTALSLLRLRLPSVALVGAAALFGALPVTGSLLALTAFRAAARVQPARRLRVAVGLAVVADGAAALASSQYGWSITVAGHLAALLVCVGLPFGVQVMLGKADGHIAALRERAQYLEDNYRLANSAARLQERSRIAQEMHDQLGHRLSLISLYAGALELSTASNVPAVADDARLIRGTVHTAMQELRSTLGILRAADEQQEAQLQPVDETGTRADLARLVAQSRSAGVRVGLSWHGVDLTGAALPVRRAAHRLVREALTNIHRHAPGADATVTVWCGGERLRLEVVNGRPTVLSPPARGNGLGLVGVRERVRLLGGTFSAGPTPAGGFRIVAELALADPVVLTVPPADEHRVPVAPQRRLGGSWGTSAVLAVGVVGVPALVSVLLNAVSAVVPGSTPYVFSPDAVHLGMTRSDVVNIVGDDDPVVRMAARAVETPAPQDTSCIYSEEPAEKAPSDMTIVRYCFRDNRLVANDTFPIR